MFLPWSRDLFSHNRCTTLGCRCPFGVVVFGSLRSTALFLAASPSSGCLVMWFDYTCFRWAFGPFAAATGGRHTGRSRFWILWPNLSHLLAQAVFVISISAGGVHIRHRQYSDTSVLADGNRGSGRLAQPPRPHWVWVTRADTRRDDVVSIYTAT